MPVVDALNSLSNWSETQTSKVVHGLHREIAPMLLKLSGTTPTTSELLNKIIRAGLISPSWVPSGCMDVARFNCSRNDSTVLDYITISSMTTTPDQCTAEIFFVESSVRYIEEKTQRTSHMMKLNPTPYPHEQEGYSFRSFSPSSKWNIFYGLVCRKRGALHTTFSHPVPGCSLLCPLLSTAASPCFACVAAVWNSMLDARWDESMALHNQVEFLNWNMRVHMVDLA